jgi:hypothetical protein
MRLSILRLFLLLLGVVAFLAYTLSFSFLLPPTMGRVPWKVMVRLRGKGGHSPARGPEDGNWDGARAEMKKIVAGGPRRAVASLRRVPAFRIQPCSIPVPSRFPVPLCALGGMPLPLPFPTPFPPISPYPFGDRCDFRAS